MNDPLASLWVEKYRPTTLEDIVLSKEDREFFESLKTKKEIPHLLFSGPPGVGKTSISKVIINSILDCQSIFINTSDGSGNIDGIRGSVMGFAKSKSIDGNLKVVFLDEIDSASFDSQRALRGIIEECASTCRFIFTTNYLNKIVPALQSRCQVISLNPPLDGIVSRIVSILKKENITIPPDQKPLLLNHIKKNLPDLRRIINDIQKFSVSGILNIRFDNCSEFAEGLFKKIQKQDLLQVRKEVIENEKVFSNDYGLLLKQLFEVIFQSSIDYEKKLNMLMIVSKSLENHSLAVDKEINFFSALISLSKAF
jgi:DNA polymerase III delta prime subunit